MSISLALFVTLNLLALSFAAIEPIKCSVAWFPNSPASIVTISPDKINDGYCDCPLDGADETETGACSGSDLWAGVGGRNSQTETVNSFFVCPQQPSLKLAYSRVNDGICDCCDGSDEKESGKCADICDEVLAAERAARAKLKADYETGSNIRDDSIDKYQHWMGEMREKLQKLKDDLGRAEAARSEFNLQLKEGKINFAKIWTDTIINYIPSDESLTSLVGMSSDGSSEHMSVDDLSSLIISLCTLSGEVSSDNFSNGRCVALDRASIDVGIIWDHVDNDSKSLPTFHYLDIGNEDSLLEYADIMAEINGSGKKAIKRKKRDNAKSKRDYDDDDMNPDYQADEEDYNDEDYNEADYDVEAEVKEELEDNSDENIERNDGPSIDEIVQSRLKKLHLSRIRDLFKEQADMLLKITPSAKDVKEDSNEKDEQSTNEGNEDADSKEEDAKPGFDPAAMNMAKSTINKLLSGVHRGEASAKFAARHIISLIKTRTAGNRSLLFDMQLLALRMMYHSQISAEDIAEVIYTTSTTFTPDMEVDQSTCPATSPWNAMCPPKSFKNNGSNFPPDFIVNAGTRLCEERAGAMTGVCAAQENLDVTDFPTTINRGYYNYYSPKERGESDGVDEAFSKVNSLLAVPSKLLSDIMSEANKHDEEVDTIKKSIDKLVSDMGGVNATKFGLDGELFALRDTCHSIESGKYEYEVCIFGKATQRDIGQKHGGTNLGSWKTMRIDEKGVRSFLWTDGTKCWNGPHRSAEVVVTCGGLETKLLTADEPETCRYVFTMESPIGCDGMFKLHNSL